MLPACKSCNNSFSKDELYLSCLLDMMKYTYFGIEEVELRDKTKKSFDNNRLLLSRFDNLIFNNGSNTFENYEHERVKNVILKLAKGHLAYFGSELIFDKKPKYFNYKFLPEMTYNEIRNFDMAIEVNILPELGSRSCSEILISEGGTIYDWISIQSYNYRVLCDGSGLVRICISEFLYSEIYWE